MKRIYRHTERWFEKLTSAANSILGNSITFLFAFGLVIFWLSNRRFYVQDIHDSIHDVILGVSFLTLFIIQRSFNHFSGSLHIKVNELVASHEPASNMVMNVEEKTELEITELTKEYSELAEQAKEDSELPS
jgi:low affinity Fe/Cu permease